MEWFRSPDFRARALHLIKTHHVPGLSIAIVQDGETVASLAFGHASLDPLVECTPDTLFDIASSSKSFTGVAVALLAQDEENHPGVRWDRPVSEMLPDFVLSDPVSTRSVTLDDMLGHRTGMPRHDLSYFGPRAQHPDTPQSVTRNLRYLPPAAPLRTKHIYNNIMFTAAAHLVAQHAGMPFSQFLRERIFDPLGMRSTSLQPSEARARGFADRIATGYGWDARAKTYRSTQAPDCHEGEGAGSIVTSANDFVLWAKALLVRGRLKSGSGSGSGSTVITETVFGELVRQRSFCNPTSRRLRPWTSPAYYGAGVEVYYYRGRSVVTHTGGIDGFGSRFAVVPDAGFGVVVCGNAEGVAAVSGILTRELIDEALGIPREERSYGVKPERRGVGKGLDRAGPQQVGERVKPAADDAEQDEHGNSDSDSDSEEDEGEPDIAGTSRTSTNASPETCNGQQQQQQQQQQGQEECVALDEHELQRYTGRYHHPGYHGMTVQVQDGKLVIDARDRSSSCTIELEARRGAGGREWEGEGEGVRRFRATLWDEMRISEEHLEAEFEIGVRKAMRMGLKLEPQMKEMIWFDRIEAGRM